MRLTLFLSVRNALEVQKGVFMVQNLPYTFQRNGNYYLQIRLSNGRIYKKSLLTDSYREASALMIGVTPHISFVKSLAADSRVRIILSNLIASERKATRNPLFSTS
jgi:hypothetical protein